MNRVTDKLNVIVNLMVVVVLAGMLFGPRGRVTLYLQERWEMVKQNRLIRDQWPNMVERSSRVDTGARAVDIVVFSDYECPFCMETHESLKRFMASNPNIRIAYRHLPLASHPMAEDAARAAVCAGVQDRFREMHTVLFESDAWKAEGGLRHAAAVAGVTNLDVFERCITSAQTSAQLEADRNLAESLGIRGTPTFVTLKGTHVGAQSVAALAKLTGVQ